MIVKLRNVMYASQRLRDDAGSADACATAWNIGVRGLVTSPCDCEQCETLGVSTYAQRGACIALALSSGHQGAFDDEGWL